MLPVPWKRAAQTQTAPAAGDAGGPQASGSAPEEVLPPLSKPAACCQGDPQEPSSLGIGHPGLRHHPDLGDGSGMDTCNKLRALKISKGWADMGAQHPYGQTPREHPRARPCPGAAKELSERGSFSLSPFLPRGMVTGVSKLPLSALSGRSLLAKCCCTLSPPLPQNYFFGSRSLIFPARQLLHGGTESLAAPQYLSLQL